LQFGGQKIDEVLFDDTFHVHSDTAIHILDDYLIGELSDDNSCNEKKEENYFAGKVENFIKVDEPMFFQCLRAKWTKEEYLKQIHIPRHSAHTAPVLGGFLEIFTKTPWYVIPIVWLPVVAYYLKRGLEYNTTESASQVILLFFIGIFNWSLIEYSMHRFIFHVDEILPDNQYAFTFHFMTHGIHHYLPMDRLRLVMPPVLLVILSYPIVQLHHLLFSNEIAYPLIGGAYFDYLHHGKPYTAHIREMKSYHLDHHYKEANLGFGISSKLWDRVFNTLLTDNDIKSR
ncbi:fatty acid alpha-hydroxylase, partial [Clydaea vesicula]